ncbi:YjfB family protein [Clostridium estertheticum]|uniref:YjfB family protein n=1 Tax=Clostridium estertheticum TaxID=238834 RepID=UPI001CF244AD|nr:YjfB family protein [Clostridium estertheticum]MCB2308794.1 YjfB family protein [Clostridium estertheticum]MCB2347128.1 YjfB family protein [Clostridium estertheticum]MCB2351780.1 YjfB family protein [Clostridium estertheticum]WAG44498.1 YjfB family protein [Clostridium estertheticum]
MDVGAISMVMSQSNVQQDAGIAVMKMAMNTGKQNATQITEMMKNVAIDTNVGQNLDVRA